MNEKIYRLKYNNYNSIYKFIEYDNKEYFGKIEDIYEFYLNEKFHPIEEAVGNIESLRNTFKKYRKIPKNISNSLLYCYDFKDEEERVQGWKIVCLVIAFYLLLPCIGNILFLNKSSDILQSLVIILFMCSMLVFMYGCACISNKCEKTYTIIEDILQGGVEETPLTEKNNLILQYGLDRLQKLEYRNIEVTNSSIITSPKKIRKPNCSNKSNISGNSDKNKAPSFLQIYHKMVDEEYNKLSKNYSFSSPYSDAKIKNYISRELWENEDAIKNICNEVGIPDYNEIIENLSIKEEKRIANHIAYEGRISSSDKRKIKKLLGDTCAACGKKMSDIYGDLGKGYMELHHKIPYADLSENDTRLLKADDFCVLCPNCHKMIHKLDCASDVKLLSEIIQANKK